MNLGYNAQYFIWKNTFVEAGLDFQYVFVKSTYANAGWDAANVNNHIILRPTIGIGWQFGRWAEYAEVYEAAAWGEDHSVPVSGKLRNEWFWSVGLKTGAVSLSRLDSFVEYGFEYYEKMNTDLGLGFNIGSYPLNWSGNKLGFGLELTLRPAPSEYRFSDVSVYLRYQRTLYDDIYLNLTPGFLIKNAYTLYYQNSQSGDETYLLSVRGNESFKLGVSVQYFFWSNAFVEAGFDYSTQPSADPKEKTYHFLRPGISIGFQHRRGSGTGSGLNLPGTGLPRRPPSVEIADEAED